jgi:CRISPR-associated protein Cmr5
MKLMQQQRAEFALKQVQEAAENLDKAKQKEYLSYAASLPAMIHTNGLGQAAAFFKAKGGTHELLYNLLSDWLIRGAEKKEGSKNAYEIPFKPPFNKANDLLEGITTSDMQTYRLAQAEAQALMDWVKKFAKAFMSAGDNEKKED